MSVITGYCIFYTKWIAFCQDLESCLTKWVSVLRESSFNMTRGGGMKILRGDSEKIVGPGEGL